MTRDNEDKWAISRRRLGGVALGAALIAAGSTADAAERASGRSLTLVDRVAIEDLFSAYVWAYDCSDIGEFLSLFTEDALVVGRGTMYRGQQAIAGWFNYLLGIREDEGDDIWMHQAGQFRFDGNASPVIVYAYATHFNGNTATATRGVRSLGYFVCECVETDDGWKFSKFSITTWDRTTLPWRKPLPWANA